MIIDVSHHNGLIDWKLTGKFIDYAILRCGYGSNSSKNVDKCFNYNATQCEKYGIPYGVYLYSYAKTRDNNTSEINHILSAVSGRKVTYPLYYDIEENRSFESGLVREFACNFVNRIRGHHYKAGLYSFDANFKQYFNSIDCDSRWVARYSAFPPNSNFDLWQYTSMGHMAGIKGFVDYSIPLSNTVFSDDRYDQIVEDVLNNKYGVGKARKDTLVSMGINYWKVQNLVNKRLGKG